MAHDRTHHRHATQIFLHKTHKNTPSLQFYNFSSTIFFPSYIILWWNKKEKKRKPILLYIWSAKCVKLADSCLNSPLDFNIPDYDSNFAFTTFAEQHQQQF